jgi:hypothetical protein
VYYGVIIVAEERCDFEVGALRQELEVEGACHWITTATIIVMISGVLVVG